MTRAQALTEARKRWGHDAIANSHGWPSYDKFVANAIRTTLGYGDTWETAFADAERRVAHKPSPEEKPE
jgi:hypothetical protein